MTTPPVEAARAALLYHEGRRTGLGGSWIDCTHCRQLEPDGGECPARLRSALTAQAERLAEVERDKDAAVGKMQEVVYLAACGSVDLYLGERAHYGIDGGASDGDEYALTKAEVEQAIGMVGEALEEEREKVSALRARVAELEAQAVERERAFVESVRGVYQRLDEQAAELANERGEGEPPVPGWKWIGTAWVRPDGAYVDRRRTRAGWCWMAMPVGLEIDTPTARAGMLAADAALSVGGKAGT